MGALVRGGLAVEGRARHRHLEAVGSGDVDGQLGRGLLVELQRVFAAHTPT